VEEFFRQGREAGGLEKVPLKWGTLRLLGEGGVPERDERVRVCRREEVDTS